MRLGLSTVDQIDTLFTRWVDLYSRSELPSRLYRFNEGIDPVLVLPTAALNAGLSAAFQCLWQVQQFVMKRKIRSTSIAVRGLIRAAMLGSAHTLYVLLPKNPDERALRARQIAQLEAKQLREGVREFAAFSQLAGLGLGHAQSELIDRAATGLLDGGVITETRILRTVGTDLGELLPDEGTDPNDGYVEQLMWIWRSFSGIAHAFAWPEQLAQHRVGGSVPHTGPGDLVTDFVFVATMAHVAFDQALQVGDA